MPGDPFYPETHRSSIVTIYLAYIDGDGRLQIVHQDYIDYRQSTARYVRHVGEGNSLTLPDPPDAIMRSVYEDLHSPGLGLSERSALDSLKGYASRLLLEAERMIVDANQIMTAITASGVSV